MTGQAVVIGGGIAGLLAAHALSGLYDHVTLLERYTYPAPAAAAPAPPSRRGVPQSRCLHMLMAAGAAAFDDLVPGWRTDIVASGALPFDVSADAAIHLDAGWMVRTRSGITAYACSRALLEAMLRDRLAAHPRATVWENARVLGLVASADGGRVTGLSLAGQDAGLDADLVVDASGRHSALPDWLRRLPGAAAPIEETVIPSGTHYVSRWFHLPPGRAPDWQCLSMSVDPASHRSAMMLRAEGECWGVVLLAGRGDPLPTDDAGFLAFSAGLADGALHDVLRHATPVSPIHRHAPSANRLRHAERHTGWPANFVALGDSVCALDPFFGLGMTAAARGAVGLRQHLAENRPAGLAFQQALSRALAEPWRQATGRHTDGRRIDRDAAGMARICAAAVLHPAAARAVLAVQHLLRPPESLTEVYQP